MTQSYDAIIIGGGPAGATAAILLARAGWSVAVVESVEFPRRKVCGEFLSATSLPLLQSLGVGEIFDRLAGPPVRRVAVFTRNDVIAAEMPAAVDAAHRYGRALGREHLDAALLDRAAAEGAIVWQPWRAVCTADRMSPASEIDCTLAGGRKQSSVILRSPIVIAAHGSWERGTIATQQHQDMPHGSDLFGFKVHFLGCDLPVGMMPLITFPGGYGGMVHTDQGRISLSCCIRRDTLATLRRRYAGRSSDALIAHMKATCGPLRDVLARSTLEDRWRAAGPIHPGVRATRVGRIFLAGNAAGEAHPVVAEGISMAMQSGWLLATHLINGTHDDYDEAWRRMFQTRIIAASCIAHWAMRPALVACALPFLGTFPAMLTEGARTAGKVTPLCSSLS